VDGVEAGPEAGPEAGREMGLVLAPSCASVALGPGTGGTRSHDNKERVVLDWKGVGLGQGLLKGAGMSLAQVRGVPSSGGCFWVHAFDAGLAHLVGKDKSCVLQRIGGARAAPNVNGIRASWANGLAPQKGKPSLDERVIEPKWNHRETQHGGESNFESSQLDIGGKDLTDW
jgi:hypothetical protein